jgi:hypothetical protein
MPADEPMKLPKERDTLTVIAVSVALFLQLGFFFLTCVGLLVATGLLYMKLITGQDWLLICGTLFSADRIGHAVTQIGGSRGPSP